MAPSSSRGAHASSAQSSPAAQSTLLSFFTRAKGVPSSPTRAPPAAKPKPAKPTSARTNSQAAPASEQNTASSPPAVSADALLSSEADSANLASDLTVTNSDASALASSPRRRRKRAAVFSDSESDAPGSDAEASEWSVDDTVFSQSDAEEPAKPVTPAKKLGKSRNGSAKPRESPRLSQASPISSQERVAPAPGAAADVLKKFEKETEYVPVAVRAPAPKKVKVEADERYAWLLDVKDADMHPVGHPDYDPRTLHIPSSAWAKFTPFEKQYWEVKHKLFNTVVFFKKGKFYELYENDAQIAHSVFDLKLAGGGRANMSLCGVPEMSFDYWASAFIAKGYKVARVDQAETALGKEMRDQKLAKKEEKIIRRELSCVLTGGTLTDSAMLVGDLSQFCLSLKQDGLSFAACFVDTAASQFYLANFTDKSADYPMLETLLAQTRPKELVMARGNLDRYALKIVRNNTSVDTLWEILKPDVEFWDADTARREIGGDRYFAEPPQDLAAGLESDLAASAIGGLLFHLRSLKLDEQLLSLGQFHNYDATAASFGATLILDGQTLQNLEVFANSWDGGSAGTLYQLVNKCVTPFGKRRLRSWLAHPLQLPAAIRSRADAVDMFIAQDEVASALRSKLSGLPDAERMLARVHAGSLKPKDFVRLVAGLERCAGVLAWLAGLTAQLPQLKPFLSPEQQLRAAIDPWMSAFDHMEAKENDKLVPEQGVDEEFDATLAACKDTEKELRKLLETYKVALKSKALEYRDSGKEIYLIEVPTKLAKQVPADWQQMGATAKCKRFYTPELRRLVRQLQEAQELHNMAAATCQQKLYTQFCSAENYQLFTAATKTIAAVDCLLSLAETSSKMAVHCRPEILETDDSFLEFEELRHPTATSTDFIPNDVCLGGKQSRMSLLTGANAAGKSTVLRTTGCAVLLAQLGCHVPARSARLTPVDRVMTRLGASDNIFAGKSTFHMELAETERILNEATSRSFVVVDELGRGGSSSDGFAIAESVLHHLATHVGCLGFFATHYATLYDSFTLHPQVKPERMAILVNQETREVTFLYKLEAGRSEGSFGMNVALMCGVDKVIVEAAEKAAAAYEQTSRATKLPALPLGMLSDVEWMETHDVSDMAMSTIECIAGQIVESA